MRLNDAQLALRGPECVNKISPTPLHHHHQPEPLRQGRMDPWFRVLYAKFWPYHLNVASEIKTHQTRQSFSKLLLSNFGEPVWKPPFPYLTLVVTSGYLSYCCRSIISNQSAHSPLTSGINKAFSSTQLPLTGYFLFFGPFSVNSRDGCVWKSQ